MEKFGINPNQLYRAKDPVLAAIGSVSVLAQWRHYGRGPAFIRREGKIFYSGADLIEWLEQGRVEATDGNRSIAGHGDVSGRPKGWTASASGSDGLSA